MQTTQALVAGRTVLGVSAYLAPELTGKLFGLDPVANPQAPYLGRLFGARDVALAFGVVTNTGSQRSQWLRIGVACDLADVAAGIIAGRSGQLPKLATVLVTATALGAAGAGIAALMGEQ